ncbi:CoxG family protein [Paraburkholderia antibiotica]|uniref:SRPBCC family protein n=1 Tax=Paraburkholderia antibiotica TaxID=2728839 RepID=A0A7X9X7J2_9BURK|nr:SRPBCC family protein [Paraburkholderia antibiotica]NML32942.1 SRPBCC family protein [Paraburkholderia antibiotica]
MEFEKKVVIDAPIEKVWSLLLDPNVMAGCVPGTESVEVVSDVEYLANVKVKISFIAARFRIRTVILETRPPYYLKSEGTGEDSSIGSSLKQSSELTLTELSDDRTELAMKISVDVFGRLGAFGLTVMKTKADRMWEEFGANLNARAVAGAPQALDTADSTRQVNGVMRSAAGANREASATASSTTGAHPGYVHQIPPATGGSWWRRLFSGAGNGGNSGELHRFPTDIFIEVQRGDSTVRVLWPVQESQDCVNWLKEYLK